jgi:uncharacterized protein YhfF
MNRVFAIIGGGSEVIQPNIQAIDLFWVEAKARLPHLEDAYHVRWIGLDEETTYEILDYIQSGEKSATYTLPWVNEAYGWPNGSKGMPIILLGFDGSPAMIVETTEVIEINFGNIDGTISGLDGPPVRDIDIWRTLHTTYWNDILRPLKLSCSPDMPVLVEKFKPV